MENRKISIKIKDVTLFKKPASKGDRLKWTPIKEIKPEKLMAPAFNGKLLSDLELEERKRRDSQNTNLLVP